MSWEIPELIAKEMEEQGAKVDVIPAGKVDSFDDYQMIVLGAPIYTFMWPKQLHRFLSKNREVLKTLPTAVFVVGTNIDEGQADWNEAQTHISKALKKFDWFKPTSLKLFSIKMPVDTTPILFKIFQRKASCEAEIDWTAIRKWAGEMAKGKS